MIIITFGTFDLFHYGHLRILKRCRDMLKHPDDKLIVGVSSDAFNYTKKQRYPIISQQQRMEIIKAIKGVDEVFVEESSELKKHYCAKYQADVLIMGDDHKDKFDFVQEVGTKAIYLPRTEYISTTEIIEKLMNKN